MFRSAARHGPTVAGLILVLLTLLLTGPQAVAQGAMESEPNDRFGDAEIMTANGAWQAAISPAGDRDWFEIEVDHHGELRVDVSGVPQGLAVNVRVWNANRDILAGWFAPLAAGGPTNAVIDLPTPGRYVLEIAGGDGNQTSAQAFTIQTTFTPSPEQIEPNNSFGESKPLTLGQPIPLTILPAGDRDWVHFSVDHHGELRLSITDVPAGMAVDVRVWNSNRDILAGWFMPLAAGGDTLAVVDLPAPGRYALEIAADRGEMRSVEAFTLQADFTASADAFEPNNSFGQAQPLPLGQPVQATLLPAGDRDWLRFGVEQHGELRLAITNVPPTLAVNVRVWNANRDILAGWFAPLAVGGDTLAVVDLPAPGDYVLEIAGNDGAQRDITPFLVQATFTPAADVFEPNNSFGAARAINLGTSVPINLLPAGDRDWFMIRAPHHGELRLAATQVPADLAVNLRVWDANRDILAGWFAPLARGGDTAALVDLPRAGRYFIEVAGGDGSERNINSFLLHPSFTTALDQGEPNNTFETAIPIVLDTTLPGNILPAGDRDWYQVEIVQAGELHITVVTLAPSLTVSFRLWDADRRIIGDWFRPLATGGNVEAVIPIATPGTYILEVADNNGSARAIEPYLLRFSMHAIDAGSMTVPAATTGSTGVTVDPGAAQPVAPAGTDQVIPVPGRAGVRVTVPANALPAGENVVVEVGEITNFGELTIETVILPGLGPVGLDFDLIPVGPVVSLQPSGLTFAAPVRVELPIDPDGIAPHALGYWVLLGREDAGGAWTWEALADDKVIIDQANGMATALIDHFSGAAPVAVVAQTPPLPPAPGARPATPEEVVQLKNMVSEFIGQFTSASLCFAPEISLGDVQLYRGLLDNVNIVIDTGRAGAVQGEMSADGATLTLVTAPGDVSANQRPDYLKTLWHELTHRIEVDNWDRWTPWIFSPFGHSAARAERNTEYMDHAIGVLVQIQRMEGLVGQPGVTEEQLRQRWALTRSQLASGSPNTFASVPDLVTLRNWTGFHVDLDAIEARYRSGQCGATLQRVFEPSTPATGQGGGAPTPSQPAGEPYYVFLAANNEILVGRKSELEVIASCSLVGWGIDCTKTVAQVTTLSPVLGPYNTSEEARAAYCADLVPDSVRYPPLQVGTLGRMGFDGQDHWISNAPGCR